MRFSSYWLACLIIITASGCGWRLRGWHMDTTLTAIHLAAVDAYAPLTLALVDAMQQRGIDNQVAANLQLELGNERLTKRTVAVTSIGSPSQYELSLTVSYQYRQKGQEITTPKQATSFRVFDFDPSNTVAKTEEENILLEEMRRELAHQILQKTPR